MFQWTTDERTYLAVTGVACVAAVARLVRLQPVMLVVGAAVGALGFFVLHAVAIASGWDGETYRDFICFWRGGNDLLAGREPYTSGLASGLTFLNPPTALPLFAGLGAMAPTHAYWVWTTINVVLAVSLVPLAKWALVSDGCSAAQGLDPTTILGLTAAVCLSNADRANLINGQMAALTAASLTLAYGVAARGSSLATAVALTVATVKIGTMLPFLALLLRGRRWVTGGYLIVCVAGLCLLTAGPSEQFGRLNTIATAIAKYGGEGQINDYSRSGPHAADIIGLDRLYYHIGVGDRGLIRGLQFATLVALGLALITVTMNPATPRGLAASLLAVYAVVFLYHRTYDTVLLALPLAFAVGHARTTGGAARWWMTAAAVAMLLVLYMPRRALSDLMHRTFDSKFVGAVVEYAVLPLPTWLVLLSLGCLWIGGRRLVAGHRPTAAE